jgi:integrase
MARGTTSGRRPRAQVRVRGGSHQVIVYAGIDPVTGKEVRLRESTKDPRKVEAIKARLLAKVDSQRNASTNATLGYVIDRWMTVHEGERSTLDTYRGYIERTIKPALGDVQVSRIRARNLEEFYAELRRCGARCADKPFIEHRTAEPHDCRTVRHRRPPGRPSARWAAEHDCTDAGCTVSECQPHVCRPMARSTVRQIHAIISGSLSLAVRWEWIPSNPAAVAEKPKQSPPEPEPPTAEQAARITEAAWDVDLDWGTLVWLAMVTGARRGELASLRWRDIRWDIGVVVLRKTKTHRSRRPSLDPLSMEILAVHYQRYLAQIEQLGIELDDAAFVFSYEVDHSRPCNVDGLTHKYKRLCRSLGIDSHLHATRHYSATELISAGVDVRTVAGRLGHGGGGATTLRVYAAWVAESDKRAASILAGRLPRPGHAREPA